MAYAVVCAHAWDMGLREDSSQDFIDLRKLGVTICALDEPRRLEETTGGRWTQKGWQKKISQHDDAAGFNEDLLFYIGSDGSNASNSFRQFDDVFPNMLLVFDRLGGEGALTVFDRSRAIMATVRGPSDGYKDVEVSSAATLEDVLLGAIKTSRELGQAGRLTVFLCVCRVPLSEKKLGEAREPKRWRSPATAERVEQLVSDRQVHHVPGCYRRWYRETGLSDSASGGCAVQ